jgi:hypothetical protein
MEGGTYATLIPVHTVGLGPEAGTSMLFGFDCMDMMPETVGLVPVLVEEPKGTSYRPKDVLDRWRQCFQWMYLSSQPDNLLDFSGSCIRNSDSHESIKGSLSQARNMYTRNHALGLTGFDDIFCNFLVDLRVLPRKVVKSPCQGCAQDGGWTLTLSWALWHPMKEVMFPRWDPLMPSKPESAAANETHAHDFLEYCDAVWMEVREVFTDIIEDAASITYYEAVSADEDGTLMQEVEEEADKRWCGVVGNEHRQMWHPPGWLLESFSERFYAEASAIIEADTLTSRFLRHCGLEDPYDIWAQGLKAEIRERRSDGA